MDPGPFDPLLFGPDQACFGCGPGHPFGLHLRFAREGDAVVTRFTPGEQYQGPPGIMHGGLVSTACDELAAWTVVGLLDKFGFTASMSFRLSRPVRIGVETVGMGRLVAVQKRLVKVSTQLLQGDLLCCTGEFTFALANRAQAEALLKMPLPPGWERFCQ